MFEGLSKYQTIFVTGPNRSGTTIAARMIAQDTGHDLVLEDDFGYSNINRMLAFIHSGYGPLVIQCPFLSHVIHDLEYIGDVDMDSSLIVFMHRYRRDIIDSELRANEKNGVDFESVGEKTRYRYHFDGTMHASDLKYEAWEKQRPFVPNYLDLGYESLRGHPLWIEKRDFALRQTDYDSEGPSLPATIGFAAAVAALANHRACQTLQ